MGLFDKFKKKPEHDDVRLPEGTDKLIQQANKFIDDTKKIDREDNSTQKKVERLKIAKLYEEIKRRVDVLKKLLDENKLRISLEGQKKLEEWLRLYDMQMSTYDYGDTTAKDLVIPEFPVTKMDVFYPASNIIAASALIGIWDFDNPFALDSFFDFIEFFEPIKEEDELISVYDGELDKPKQR